MYHMLECDGALRLLLCDIIYCGRWVVTYLLICDVIKCFQKVLHSLSSSNALSAILVYLQSFVHLKYRVIKIS